MKRNSGTAASVSSSDSSSSSINREYDTALTRSGRPARNVNRKRTNGFDLIVHIDSDQNDDANLEETNHPTSSKRQTRGRIAEKLMKKRDDSDDEELVMSDASQHKQAKHERQPEQQKRQIEVGKSGLAMTSLNSADRTGGKAGKNKKGENPHFHTMDSYLENKSSSSISNSAGGVGGGRSSRESYSDSCEIDMDGAKGYTHTDSSPKLNGQVEELYGIQLAPRAGDGIQWRKNPSTDILDLT